MTKKTRQFLEKLKDNKRGWDEWIKIEYQIRQLYNIPNKEIRKKISMEKFNQIHVEFNKCDKDGNQLADIMRSAISREIWGYENE